MEVTIIFGRLVEHTMSFFLITEYLYTGWPFWAFHSLPCLENSYSTLTIELNHHSRHKTYPQIFQNLLPTTIPEHFVQAPLVQVFMGHLSHFIFALICLLAQP